jgi:predicted O-methyltransferase YrrM
VLLYTLVRGLKPTTVVELGVGNGHSSFFIIRALQANGFGTLHSFDVEPEAGRLLDNTDRSSWDFRLLARRKGTRELMRHLGCLPTADLCFHDADHNYLAQYVEFRRLWDQLSQVGLMVGDDVDASYALIDFCRLVQKTPEILIDGRKAVAVVSRAAPLLVEPAVGVSEYPPRING